MTSKATTKGKPYEDIDSSAANFTSFKFFAKRTRNNA